MENTGYINQNVTRFIPKAQSGWRMAGRLAGKAINAISKAATKAQSIPAVANTGKAVGTGLKWMMNPIEEGSLILNQRWANAPKAVKWLTTPGERSFMFAKTPIGKAVGAGIIIPWTANDIKDVIDDPTSLRNWGGLAMAGSAMFSGLGGLRALPALGGSRKLATGLALGVPALAIAGNASDGEGWTSYIGPGLMLAGGLTTANTLFRMPSWIRNLRGIDKATGKYRGYAGKSGLIQENGQAAVDAMNKEYIADRAKKVQEEIQALGNNRVSQQRFLIDKGFVGNGFVRGKHGLVVLVNPAEPTVPLKFASLADFNKRAERIGVGGQYKVKIGTGKNAKEVLAEPMRQYVDSEGDLFDTLVRPDLEESMLPAAMDPQLKRVAIEANRKLYAPEMTVTGWDDAAKAAEAARNQYRKALPWGIGTGLLGYAVTAAGSDDAPKRQQNSDDKGNYYNSNVIHLKNLGD